MNSRKYILLTLLLSSTMVCAQHRKPKAGVRQTTSAALANQMSAHQKEIYENMLPNTQKIFVVDSTVVDKNRVMEAIPLPPTYGKIVAYNDFFDTDTQPEQYVFVNGFGTKCYYTELSIDSLCHLYTRDKLTDGWSEPQRISEIDSKLSDVSCPFLSSDGQTLYISGVANDGLGQRDIYMAKYDAEEGKFFEPENIGMPFNSHDDDFVYVEADNERFAWFATTRRQKEGKACVYTFVMDDQRSTYEDDDISEARLKSLAALTRIRDTWPTPEIQARALARLEKLSEDAPRGVASVEAVNFVVNDNTVYNDIDDFRSDATRQKYYEMVRLSNDLQNKRKSLDELRLQYHNANDTDRTALTRKIVQLEQQVEQLRTDLQQTERSLRTEENKLIKQ